MTPEVRAVPASGQTASSTRPGESGDGGKRAKRSEITLNLTISLPAAAGRLQAPRAQRANAGTLLATRDAPWITQKPHVGSFARTRFRSSQWHRSSKDAAATAIRQAQAAAAESVPLLANSQQEAQRQHCHRQQRRAARRWQTWEAPLSCRPAATRFLLSRARRRTRSTRLPPSARTSSASITGFQSNTFVCPCSWLAVQHERRRAAGTGDAGASTIQHAIYE